MAARILIIEDEEKIAQLLAKNLEAIGLACETASDGFRAIELFGEREPDLVILDLNLPGMDGLEVCRRIRAKSRAPILMLTARRSEPDVVLGLEIGADDYMAKPFGVRELVARVRALLRRSRPPEEAEVRSGPFRVDVARRRLELDGREIEVTTLEFDLIHFLAARPGRVFSRERLLEQVWGKDRVVELRSIDSLVSRLRKKIEEDPNQPRFLQTVWGAGYRWAAE
jgi:DNA-binding response OmpR family regulator